MVCVPLLMTNNKPGTDRLNLTKTTVKPSDLFRIRNNKELVLL